MFFVTGITTAGAAETYALPIEEKPDTGEPKERVMTKARTHLALALVSAALVLTAILAIAPQTTVVANEVSGEIYGINILGGSATSTPAQQAAAR